MEKTMMPDGKMLRERSDGTRTDWENASVNSSVLKSVPLHLWRDAKAQTL
jgi:hypothetical protein